MLDIRKLREDPEGVLARLRRRDPDLDLSTLLSLEEERRGLLHRVEELRRQRKQGSQKVALLRAQGEEGKAQQLISSLKGVSEELKELEGRLSQLEGELEAELLKLPNLPHDSVPSGPKEEKLLLRAWGEPQKFDFPPKHHVELGRDLGLLDFQRAAKVAGARFPMYTGLGAMLELALVCWMFQLHVRQHGYIPVLPPILANRTSYLVSGQLPKFEDELYHCEKDDLFLNPTAESLLVNLHRDEVLAEEELPLRYVAYTPCFRREAGTYGEEQRGLIRLHQFNKVELFHFTTPERSYQDLEALVGHAERVLQELGLHYRVMLLTSQDLAQQSAKTVDIEVWLPGQGRYYEVSSCSNCEEYQARRGNIRFRPAGGGKPRFVHTLNGSGVATSRLFAAILEQNQTPAGTVVLPERLAELLGERELS
ncbi:MAG: Serine--tRNA ligase [Acetothermia bacterium 64_32]|nr:MAG: Serine--tRNA ligase [Acetothermia bacterium 64_32]MBC7097559.1 serine--tRNA ligase [Candidatus Bipolaricaulota bacterium]HAF71124.1 serine--tRNA ligase [Candidatus Acetothermia bacterium]